MARERTCWCCKAKFTQGYTVGILVSRLGGGDGRRQNYQIAMEVCQACGLTPGGRRTRWALWAGLKAAIAKAAAVLAPAPAAVVPLSEHAATAAGAKP